MDLVSQMDMQTNLTLQPLSGVEAQVLKHFFSYKQTFSRARVHAFSL
jgi:hypothetical protein